MSDAIAELFGYPTRLRKWDVVVLSVWDQRRWINTHARAIWRNGDYHCVDMAWIPDLLNPRKPVPLSFRITLPDETIHNFTGTVLDESAPHGAEGELVFCTYKLRLLTDHARPPND